MFSILIPTYHYDCSALVRELFAQVEVLQRSRPELGTWEILVCADGEAEPASDYGGARIVPQPVHGGLAVTRNHLAREARGEYLIFMDADARVCVDDFLLRYAEMVGQADVVCGALRNPAGPPQAGHELRYRYEHEAEKRRPASWRNAHPYECLTTFNIMVSRRVMEKVGFDERCREYGYEDTLFGLRLEQEGFSILHTDNPLIHTGIDSNESFLEKTEKAMRTLHRLGEPLQSRVGASRACRRLQGLGLLPLWRAAFRLLRPALLRNLRGHSPSLWLFKMYKLGLYASLEDEKTGEDAARSDD
ncbi:MAG: glycosyltransferase family 2 protein [Alloprevotella sp.]|nr:glycosyltransferase family 2 protein [Alloprevotella sp.]